MWEPLEESQLLISRQANGFDALSVEHHALFYKPWVYTKSFTLFSPVLKAMAMLKPPGTTSLFHLLYSPTTKETMYKTCIRAAYSILLNHLVLFILGEIYLTSLLSWLMKTFQSRLTINALFYHLQSSSCMFSCMKLILTLIYSDDIATSVVERSRGPFWADALCWNYKSTFEKERFPCCYRFSAKEHPMLIISTHPTWYTTSRMAMQKQRSTERNSGGSVAALHGFLGSALQSRGSSTRRKKERKKGALPDHLSFL